MKRKILLLLFLFTAFTSNVNASKFKFILQDFLTKPAFEEIGDDEQIYIDTTDMSIDEVVNTIIENIEKRN